MSDNTLLDSEDSIFNFILSRDIHDCEQTYMKSINTLENSISNYVSEIKFENLIETPRNFNENHTWINNKYVELVKLKISLDLITENIISFYEKK